MAGTQSHVLRRIGLGLGACVLGLAVVACGGDPQARLRTDVEAITEAANARDAEGLRARVADLEVTLTDQLERGEISATQADQLRTHAQRLADSAEVLAEPPPPPAVQEVPQPAAPPPEPPVDADEDESDDGGDDEKGKSGDKGKGKDSD